MQQESDKSKKVHGDAPDEKPITIKAKDRVWSLVFSPDSQQVIAGDNQIWIWDIHGTAIKDFKLPSVAPSAVSGGALALSGLRAFSAILMFESPSLEIVSGITDISVSHDGQSIFNANDNGLIQELAASSGKLIRQYRGHDFARKVTVSHDDKYIISSGTGTVRIWSRATGECLRKLDHQHTNCIDGLAISRNGKYIVSGDAKNQVSLWEFNTGKLLKKLLQHSEPITSIAITPDSQTIVSASVDGTICLWNLETGTLLRNWPARKKSWADADNIKIHGIAINPDGRYIVAGYTDMMRILNIATGEEAQEFAGQTNILRVAISPDGRHIASASENSIMLRNFPPALLADSKADRIQSPESEVLKIFLEVLANPRKLSVSLLQNMLTKVSHIGEFRFAYTLVNAQLHQVPAHKDPLYGDIYKCLEKLSETCIVSPAKDQKESSKAGARYIAQYKLILDAIHRAQIISTHQKYTLDNLAERNAIFSDQRFKQLEQQVQALKHQIQEQQKQIQSVGQDLGNLKKALKAKAQRDIVFGVAKVALMFIGSGIVDMLASALDLGNFAETGSAVLNINVSEWKQLVSQGTQAIKDHMDSATKVMLRKAGYDPDELVEIWVQSAVVEVSAPQPKSASPFPGPARAAPLLPASQRQQALPSGVAKSLVMAGGSPAVSQLPAPARAKDRRRSESDDYPLHAAIRNGENIDILQDLLDIGSDINLINHTGHSPVQLAAEMGKVDVVKFLLSKKAVGKPLELLKQAKQNERPAALSASVSFGFG